MAKAKLRPAARLDGDFCRERERLDYASGRPNYKGAVARIINAKAARTAARKINAMMPRIVVLKARAYPDALDLKTMALHLMAAGGSSYGLVDRRRDLAASILRDAGVEPRLARTLVA